MIYEEKRIHSHRAAGGDRDHFDLGRHPLSRIQSGKTSCKKTSCISNLRQLGQAEMLYMQDNDDTFQSAYYTMDGVGNPVRDLRTYTKNTEVFYCPNRSDTHCTTFPGTTRCLGYGFNWGFYNTWDDGTGLLEPISSGAGIHDYFLKGKSASALSQPSSTFLFGDTWSASDYGLAVFEAWNGPGSARHASRFNYVYTDGHAGSLPQRHGKTQPDTYVVGNQTRLRTIGVADTLSPSRPDDLRGYCSAPDSAACNAIVSWFLANTVFDNQN